MYLPLSTPRTQAKSLFLLTHPGHADDVDYHKLAGHEALALAWDTAFAQKPHWRATIAAAARCDYRKLEELLSIAME